MNSSSTQRFSAIKFSPPPLDPERHLPRSRVVDLLQRAEDRGRRLFFIQAQAGQGKSSLVRQFLAKSAMPFAWYRLGPEDQDAVFLFSSLLACLRNALVDFRSPLLEQMLEKGELSAADAPRVADMLAADLALTLPAKFCLVFDDLHLLEGAPSSLAFIDALLSVAPIGLRLVLLSRWAFPDLTAGKPVELLVNADLALTRGEIAELYNRLWNIPLSSEMGDLLYRRTEGWIMGLVLLGQFLLREEPGKVGRRLAGLGRLQRDQAADYFVAEILDALPAPLRQTLLKLSLLEDIPAALAEQIAGVGNVQQVLAQLVRQNLFVRPLDNGTAFTLHHLFRDVLRTLAGRLLSDAERKATLKQAAVWYLAEGETEEALRYFAVAGDYLSMLPLLRQVGLALLARHRIATLRAVLLQVPDAEIARHPWLAYFRGMLEVETAPPQALGYLENARAGFVEQGDRLGELLSTAQQVHFHLMIDGRFTLAVSLLERADLLFLGLAEEIDLVSRIKVAHILALGHYFLFSDRTRVERYSIQAWQLAVENDFDDLQAEILIIRGYLNAMLGDWSTFKAMAETAQSLIGNPRVSDMHKLFLRLMQLNLLSLEGDVVNYSRQRKVIEQVFASDLLTKTVLGPLFWVLDIDVALTENRLGDAMNFVQLGLSSGYAARNPHLRSQYLQYQAFLLATEGRRQQALEVVDESLRLRNEAGGRLFTAINLMILGTACAQLGVTGRAEELLGRAIAECEAIEEKFARYGAYAFRGMLRLESGRPDEGRQDLACALRGMRENRFVHFFLATPPILEAFLCAAVRLGVETDYARKVAAAQLGLALLEKGRAIPLLRVATLGPLVVRFGFRAEVREEGWSSSQRDFWACLLTSAGLCVSQEQMQLALWPESAPEKSRASFDTLLLRIRRVLDAICYPLKAKYYLSMQNKMLCLDNGQLDAGTFAERIRAGLRLFRQKKFWQAGNELYPALQLWQGGYLNRIPADGNSVAERRADLLRLYLEGSLAWGTMLAEDGAFEEAIEAVADALRHDPTSHALIRGLYDLHVRCGDPVGANSVVGQYRQALAREAYSADEIAEIVDSLWEINS
ncbi:BTAD domain-containing putative transcriptional regulator [Trichloromonas sp.]|uniref:BTAD domain-containing putative transcriptional regulator n=1 Tax=Trichloromonas sp. TaxID=3069249 RepID=UPI003D8152BF